MSTLFVTLGTILLQRIQYSIVSLTPFGNVIRKNYQDFQQRVPVQTYEEIKGYVDRMRHGEKNILWPGEVVWYAKSSGTTNDKSKFIPVSKEGLQTVHYAGGRDAVALYLQQNPESRIFSGRTLILGGSHAPNYNLKNSLVGDLSAILIENINPLVNLIRVPEKKIALLSDFEKKMEKIQFLLQIEAKAPNLILSVTSSSRWHNAHRVLICR